MDKLLRHGQRRTRRSPRSAGPATTDSDNIYIADAASGHVDRHWLKGRTDYTASLTFSPDGSPLATGDFNGTVLLWTRPAESCSAPVQLTISGATTVHFDSAGRLVVATQVGGLWRWAVNVPDLINRACAIAGRNLTRTEWEQLRTGHPYFRACRQRPISPSSTAIRLGW